MKTYGQLANRLLGVRLPLQVLLSGGGFYIGTIDEEGPVSRESCEYWPTQSLAESALHSGDWNQREHP
jgi:hypothetical protein